MTTTGIEREGGFIVIWRRIRSSPLWRSLSAEQKGVLVTLLLLANWKSQRVLYAGRWVEIARGEFFHSLKSIAVEAVCSVKVVRTTIAALRADDSGLGGSGPFLSERWTGTETGRGLRVLTVVNYDKYQRAPAEEGTETGTTGARDGHAEGTQGAPREPVEPYEPVEPKALAASPPARPAKRAGDPRHAPLVARLTSEAQAIVPAWKFQKKYARAVTDLLAAGTNDEISLAWRRSVAGASRWPFTADLLQFEKRWNDIQAALNGGPAPRNGAARGVAPPSDWSDPKAKTEVPF